MKRLVICAVVLCGCESLQAPVNKWEALGMCEPQNLGTYKERVEIVTDPPGAAIEIGNEYIGKAPITATVLRTMHLNHNCSQDPIGYTIKASPTLAGHCQQEKHISGDSPNRVYLQMDLCKTLNLNINQQ